MVAAALTHPVADREPFESDVWLMAIGIGAWRASPGP